MFALDLPQIYSAFPSWLNFVENNSGVTNEVDEFHPCLVWVETLLLFPFKGTVKIYFEVDFIF